ncbi:unnamed protein product [Prorocentrum cordatum]|uniref:Coatomer subunit zeta n=1 Tax=Prorocentrum cordatum TaxID=2364126 RepID=A0ABN9QQH9_9DINO|nr:unnamed protein product [Polarella glacialis]
MEEALCQVLALLVLDSDGERLAVKYSAVARRELWPSVEAQVAFEKMIISKLPKLGSAKSEVDVAVIKEYTVLFQACNDVVVCAVASSTENELAVMQLVEGIFSSANNCSHATNFLSTGLSKQLVLDKLSDVLFILDEVVDDGIIMETDEEKITARIKMIDETQVSQQAQAEEVFTKATQSAKQKLLSSLMGGRG